MCLALAAPAARSQLPAESVRRFALGPVGSVVTVGPAKLLGVRLVVERGDQHLATDLLPDSLLPWLEAADALLSQPEPVASAGQERVLQYRTPVLRSRFADVYFVRDALGPDVTDYLVLVSGPDSLPTSVMVTPAQGKAVVRALREASALTSGRSAEAPPAYDSAAVDRPATRSGGPHPVYPPALRRAGVEGTTDITFVVDSTGRVEDGSVDAYRWTHPDFARAATRSIKRMRFRPAIVRGRSVRQRVCVRFAFSLNRGTNLDIWIR